MLFAYVVHLVGVSEYRLNAAQAQEIPLDSGATNGIFHFGKVEVCYVAIVTP